MLEQQLKILNFSQIYPTSKEAGLPAIRFIPFASNYLRCSPRWYIREMAHALAFQPLSVPSTLAGGRALNVPQLAQQSANARTFKSHQFPRKPWKCEKFLVGSSFEGLRGLCDYERVSRKSSGGAHQPKRKDQKICAAVSTGSTNTATGEPGSRREKKSLCSGKGG
jgi:hypothetical protein